MLQLTKPPKLNRGDRVATVSLSWGGAGDDGLVWRYEQGKKRLQEIFGLEVVEMPHTLAGTDFVYSHPEARADDLMRAFSDPQIKAVISCIGGDDSIRLLPFIQSETIRRNPKIFLGYSDSTVTHFMCMNAGLSSFYGPAILSDFAENVTMPDYTIDAIRRTLFSSDPAGRIMPSRDWTAQRLEWTWDNRNAQRSFQPNSGYEVLQGEGQVSGPLIGGCMEVVGNILGTPLFPPKDFFDGSILFLETSECLPPVWMVEDFLRRLGAADLLGRIAGMFWGKPMNRQFYEEYKVSIRRILAEFGAAHIPVLYNGSFGHNEPKTILPYGAMAHIDTEAVTIEITEPAVAE